MSGSGIVIAIDGPGGSGKSTVARAVASRLALSYLDTGAMYRAVTLVALRRGISLDDESALTEIAESVDLDVGERVSVDGEDVTEAIRASEVNAAVSLVAARPCVRAALVARQRAWTEAKDGAVVEGRDIGSVVLQDADLKIYLTASEQERARRRANEEGGSDEAAIEATKVSLAARDALDSTRSSAPLVIPDGAVVIDSTAHSADVVIAIVVDLARGVTR